MFDLKEMQGVNVFVSKVMQSLDLHFRAKRRLSLTNVGMTIFFREKPMELDV